MSHRALRYIPASLLPLPVCTRASICYRLPDLRILLDENIDWRLLRNLPSHASKAVAEGGGMGPGLRDALFGAARARGRGAMVCEQPS